MGRFTTNELMMSTVQTNFYTVAKHAQQPLGGCFSLCVLKPCNHLPLARKEMGKLTYLFLTGRCA